MKSLSMTSAILIALALAGCSKKEPISNPDQDVKAEPPQSTTVTPPQTQTESTAAGIKKVLPEADLNKAIETIRQEAAEMSLEDLNEMALKYKQMLVAKKTELKPLADKFVKIQLGDRLSPESQALTAKVKSLNETVTALSERLAVYVDAIKANGGDPTGLTP